MPLFSYLYIHSELVWEELPQDDVDRIANFNIIYEKWSREAMIWEDLNKLYNRNITVHQTDLKSSSDSQPVKAKSGTECKIPAHVQSYCI